MYRIMIAQSKRENFASLYQYLTTNVDGDVSPLELESKEELDARIEKMLNEDGYSKDDFIVVEVVDYTIDATSYTDESTDDVSEGSSDNDAESGTV